MNFKQVLFVLSALLMVGGAHATVIGMPPEYNSLIQETAAYYQVQFDGEGEATVVLRLDIYNLDKDAIQDLTIELPGRPAELRYVFQELAQNRGQPDYYRVEFTRERFSDGTKYHMELPVQILSRGGGTILLYYKAEGYVDQGFAYDFDFETVMLPLDIDKTRVSISVDEDLYLRGGKTRVDYQSSFSGVASSLESSSKAMMASPELTSASHRVTQAAGFVKSKSNLDPWESFHVTGTYVNREHRYLLYWGEIILSIAVSIALLFFSHDKKHWKLPNLPKGVIARGVLVAATWIVETELLVKLAMWIERMFRYGFLETVFALLFLASSAIVYGVTIGIPLKPLWRKRDWYGMGLLIASLIIGLLVLGLLDMMVFHASSGGGYPLLY